MNPPRSDMLWGRRPTWLAGDPPYIDPMAPRPRFFTMRLAMRQHHTVIPLGFTSQRRLFGRKVRWWTRLWRYLADTERA